MGKKRIWHEDDVFWNTMTTRMFSEKIMATAPDETDSVLALLGVDPPAAILDLCCGAGRHAVELACRHFRVTGVDRTASYLKIARKRAKDAGLKIEFVREDMRKFCREDAFDGAINLFTSFGYFEDPNDDRQVLTNIRRSLKKGGKLVMELMGKEILARIFRERDWHETDDGTLFLQERKVAKDWSWIENRWILIEDETRHEFKVNHRIYSAAELSATLRECGFKKVWTHGDQAGGPYDHEAKRMIVVAQK